MLKSNVKIVDRVTNPNWGSGELVKVPTDRYTTREFQQLENERMWPYVWQLACREEEIPNVGDHLEYQVVGQSILLVRTAPDVIKAYRNACLHRGTQLKKGCGWSSNLTCPFHGWSWSLDGSIQNVVDRDDYPGLTDEELQLPECAVGRWAGFVFVNLDDNAASVEEFLKPVSEHLAPWRLDTLRLASWRSVIIQVNWKAALDAFEEYSHAMGTHIQALPMSDEVNTTYDNFGPHSRMIVPVGVPSPRVAESMTEMDILDAMVQSLMDVQLASEESEAAVKALREMEIPPGSTTRGMFMDMARQRYGAALPGLEGEMWMEDWDYTIFPNFVFNCLPGELFGFSARPNDNDPGDPDSCVFEVISLSLDPDRPADAEETKVERQFVEDPLDPSWGFTLLQDMRNLPRIQAGMHARPFIRLAAYQEKRIANRHRVIDQYLEARG